MKFDSPFQTLSSFYSQTSQETKNRADERRIIHCVNPFPAVLRSEHDRAQRVTLASMQAARDISNVLQPRPEVKFAAVTAKNDPLPDNITFDQHCLLARSISDLRSFKIKRDLPLIMDILKAPVTAPDDILIYTNIDIAVVPHFYCFVADLFDRGADCVVINRRTITDGYQDADDLLVMASEAGSEHPGHDCFAFRAGLLDSFAMFESCIGIGGVSLPLIFNLMAHAQAPTVLLDAHVTFHLGDDKTWKNNDFDDYSSYNRAEIHRVADVIISQDQARAKRMATRLHSSGKRHMLTDSMREAFDIPKLGRSTRAGLLRRVLRLLGRT